MSEESQEKLIEQQHLRWSIRIAWDGEFDEKNHDIEDIIADEHDGSEFVQGCVRWLFRFEKHEIFIYAYANGKDFLCRSLYRSLLRTYGGHPQLESAILSRFLLAAALLTLVKY